MSEATNTLPSNYLDIDPDVRHVADVRVDREARMVRIEGIEWLIVRDMLAGELERARRSARDLAIVRDGQMTRDERTAAYEARR